jgi:hypothetical protein
MCAITEMACHTGADAFAAHKPARDGTAAAFGGSRWLRGQFHSGPVESDHYLCRLQAAADPAASGFRTEDAGHCSAVDPSGFSAAY